MEDESPARLDRPTMVHGAIGGLTGFYFKLLEELSEANAGSFLTDADANGSILIVHAQRNDCALEARIGHPGHCQEQLA
jgi:hypothetical protein